MARIELNIVALGDFSSVNNEIKALQAQVDLLAKSTAGVGIGASLKKELNDANAAFRQTMLSTGQFNVQQVALRTETERFGTALADGKLKLTDYYNIIKQRSSEALTQFKALAVEQTKLQNSLIISDPTKQGLLSIYTPTQIDKVANATKIATNEANLYALAVKKGSDQLINWGKNTQWAGRQLTVGMSVPLMIFGQQAVSSFNAVNTELTRLQRLYGEGLTPPSQAQLDQISGQVLQLGKDIASSMGIAQSETVKAAANFAAMGIQGQNLLTTTQETMRLSKLGAVSTADATNTIVALQNVYKVSTNQLADAVNFLSDIQKQTTMTLGDMTQAIPRVGPIMQQLGGTYKDTAVMLVAMREAGIPAAQAANAVKSAVASMIAPTAAASKEWQQYGINLTAIKDQTQGNPVQMIEALQAGLSKLSPLVKEQLIEKLFGKFQFARISALLDNFGKVGSQTQNALKVAGATSGELATLANQEMKQATGSISAQWTRAVETIKAQLYPVGQKIIEIATKLMNFGNAVGKIFSGLPGPLKTVFGAIALGVALSGPIIMLTGLLGNFIGYLIKGVFNIKQLATGGKTLGQLLTPELLAAQNASKLFSEGILTDVDAVKLLSQAIQSLTTSIEGMVSSLNIGTDIPSVLNTVGAAASTEVRAYEQMRLPGFAKGVFNLGGSGPRGIDSIPALIAPGESVLSAETTQQYAPFIQRMINGTLPKYHKGTMPHTHPHNIEGQYGEGENGQIVYIGPKTGKTASAPAPIQGLGSFISAVSGDRSSIGSVADAADSRMRSLGIVPPTEGQRASYNQFDLAHIQHTPRTEEGRKVWDLDNLVTSTSAENNILNMFDKEQQTPETIKKASDLLNLAKEKLLTGGMDKNELEAEIQNLKEGGQPIGEAGRKVYKAFLEEITGEIETDIKRMQANPGSKPSSPFIASYKNGVTDLTPYGRMGYYADEYTGQRGPGGRLTPLEMLRASNYASPQKGKAIPLAQWEKDFAGPATSRVFDTSSIKTQNIAYEKALKSRLLILQQHNQQETQEYKNIANNIAIIEKQKQDLIANEELKGAAKRLEQLRQAGQAESTEAQILGKQLAEGYANGIISGSEIAKAGSKMVAKAVGAVKITQKSASPSKVAEQLGFDFGEGYVVGINSTDGQAMAAGEKLAGSATTGATTGSTKSGLVGKLFGMFNGGGGIATTGEEIGAKSGILGKFGGMFAGGSLTKGIGLSMAANVINSAVGPMLKKLPGGDILSTGASWASQGAIFGGYGAAIAGAAGLAVGGIMHLINAEKHHKEIVDATFSASSAVISAYGGSIMNATQAVYDFNSASGQTSKTLSQTAKDVASMQKLNANDPLKLIGESIKGQNTASSVIGNVQAFAAAQVANGMDPSKVSQMVTDLLTYAGKTQYLKQALNEITKSTKDQTTATETWFRKLTTASGFLPVISTDYSQLNTQQKKYADALLATTNIISSADTPMQTVIDKLKAMGTTAANSTSSINALSAALANAGQGSAAAMVTDWGNQGLGMNDIQMALMLSTKGDKYSKGLQDSNKQQLIQSLGTDVKNYYTDQAASKVKDARSQLTAAQEAMKKAAAAQAIQTSTTTGLNAKQKTLLTNDQARVKILNAQLATMKLQSQELQKQQQYNMSQADIDNQIRIAQASGDFLQANLLRQQKGMNASNYASTNAQEALQNQKDKLDQEIASLQSVVAAAKTKASNQDSLSSFKDSITLAQAAYNSALADQKNLPTRINDILKSLDIVNRGTAANPMYVTTKDPGSTGSSKSTAPNVTLGMGGSMGIPLGALPSEQIGTVFVGSDGKKYKITAIQKAGVRSSGSATVVPVNKAVGGHIVGPGSATSDSILTALSNGEYVIKTASVNKYGTSFMDSINSGSYNPRFNNVGMPTIPATSGTIGNETYNINVTVNNGDAAAIAKTIMETLDRTKKMTNTNRRISV